MRNNGAPEFIKVNTLLCRIDMFFFLIYKMGYWSLNGRFISRDFFNNYVDRLSRKQRFKVKNYPSNITVLENLSGGHISILGNRKEVCNNITDIILRIFLKMLSYWREK